MFTVTTSMATLIACALSLHKTPHTVKKRGLHVWPYSRWSSWLNTQTSRKFSPRAIRRTASLDRGPYKKRPPGYLKTYLCFVMGTSSLVISLDCFTYDTVRTFLVGECKLYVRIAECDAGGYGAKVCRANYRTKVFSSWLSLLPRRPYSSASPHPGAWSGYRSGVDVIEAAAISASAPNQRAALLLSLAVAAGFALSVRGSVQ